jgi:murein L,D-transpeptidase YafK
MLASAALAASIALAGCDTDNIVPSGRANAPLSEKMTSEIQQKRMDPNSPILVRLFKEESELEVWKKNQDGEFALLKTYPVCRWSGDLGPKVKEGDRQAPEGFYAITPGQMNPNSNYYLAFNTGYPNAFDRSLGRTGSELMVHGDCSSRGCYAMTDEQMVEIYALARESFFGGQKSFQFQAYPFRMTARNLARHRNSQHLAFWKMLKVGSDHFEATHQETKVDVCEKRYVFDAAVPEGSAKALRFSARDKCPIYEIQKDIAEVVREREQHDGAEFNRLVASNIEVAPSHAGVDGGMNPVFLTAFNTPGESDSRGMYTPIEIKTPGALPRTPNNPPAQTIIPARPIEVAQPEAAAPIVVANVPVPRSAPEPKEGHAPPTGIAGLIGNMFGNSSPAPEAQPVEVAEPAPAAAPRTAAPKTTPRTAVAKLAKPAKPAPVMQLASAPNAKPQPAAKPHQEANAGAPQLRRQIKDEPARQQETTKATPQMRTASSAPPPGNGLLSGAQPVVPAGTFESRWSGFR